MKLLFKIALCLLGFAPIGEIISQPTVLGTSTSGSYTTYDLTLRNGARYVRVQVGGGNGAATGVRNWEFGTGTAGAPNFVNNWRPNVSSLTLGGYNSPIDPSLVAASARYNTSSGGASGLMPATTSLYYYTFNIGLNAGSGNFMSVLETSFNPATISAMSVTYTVSKGNYGATDVNLSSIPSLSSGEYLYCRYTTNSFSTSTLIQITPSGTSASFTIPSQAPNSSLSFYFYTSNKTLSQINADVAGTAGELGHDLATLEIQNNGGSNYGGTTVNNNVVVNSTGGTTTPTGYATLNSVLNALSAGIHTGAITIGIYNNTSEPNNILHFYESGHSPSWSYTSIKIAPAGNASQKIIDGTALSGSKDFMHFADGDNITIDGRLEASGSTSYLKILYPNASGTAVMRFTDAVNDTIRYTAINSDISGIVYQANIETTSSVYFSNDVFGDNGANAPYGCISNGSNLNTISVVNCNFYNFTTYGIYMGGGTGGSISGNSFYQSATPPSSVTGSGSVYMLYVGSGAGWTINGNYFGGQAPQCAGSPYSNTASGNLRAMELATSVVTSVNTITNNTIQNFNLTGTTAGFYGINVGPGRWIIGSSSNGNIIGHSSNANSISMSGSSATFRGISYSTGSNYNQFFQYNTIANITLSGTTSNSSLIGMNLIAFGPVPANDVVSHNLLYNLSCAGTTSTSFENALINGILFAPGSSRKTDFYSNTIYNISAANTGSNATELNAILIKATSTNCKVYSNKIYALKNSSALSGRIRGINIVHGALIEVYNNMVSITNDVLTNGVSIVGIHESSNAGATNSSYTFNTVYIGGTQASGVTNSYAIFRDQSLTFVSNNNILYNQRSGTGLHFAIGTNSTTGFTSNYNLFVSASSSSIASGFSCNGTFSDWKTLSSADANSMAETSSNIGSANLFTAAANGDLSIITTNKEAWFCNGTGTQTSIADDYNSTSVRSTTVANGAPDLGADEFTLTSGDVPATSNLTLVSGTIADGSTQIWSFGGRTVLEITWYGTGLPTTVTPLYLPGSHNIYGCVGKDMLDACWKVNGSGATGDPDLDWGYHIKYYFDAATIRNMTLGATLGIGRRSDAANCATPYASGGWGFWDATNSGAPTKFFLNASTFPYFVGKNEWHNFSIFTVSSNNTPLPVKLISFNAEAKGNSVELAWSTATEKNNNRFEVERSKDGISFLKIDELPGAGNSNSLRNYNYTDNRASEFGALLYYRIKQIDFDGNFEYSKMVPVNFATTSGANYHVSPNPFSNLLNIQVNAIYDGETQIQLLDLQGRTLCSHSFIVSKGSNSLILETNHISPGIYLMQVFQNGNSTARKILIKE